MVLLDIRLGKTGQNTWFLRQARLEPLFFHSVFHRCGKLGEQTEASLMVIWIRDGGNAKCNTRR